MQCFFVIHRANVSNITFDAALALRAGKYLLKLYTRAASHAESSVMQTIFALRQRRA
ncbi:hypothetical protein BN2475_420042 [Paraburkholderia ribeironis]|uniref:Uncharacterized protein n=1 Tax=Paraburkholderia ribeironis TaxID=1247936 RepID=A0A1N7S7J0_9BURK|nr:hypothetical protein BN2475_420042 [Paraburkholderia ribeironis]